MLRNLVTTATSANAVESANSHQLVLSTGNIQDTPLSVPAAPTQQPPTGVEAIGHNERAMMKKAVMNLVPGDTFENSRGVVLTATRRARDTDPNSMIGWYKVCAKDADGNATAFFGSGLDSVNMVGA
jgi:hypothetical protein